MEKNPSFLKQKYDLHNSPEVEKAARQTEARAGERVPEKPAEQIQNYLERFNEILRREDPEKRQRGIDALKRVLHQKYIIQPENIPDSVFLLEQRIAREQGYGTVEITEDFKRQKTAEIINNQKQSLDKWIDYLALPDAQYPDWVKYWAVRSMLEMGKFKKEEINGKEVGRFQRRTKDTAAMFPPCNPRALAETVTAIKRLVTEKNKAKETRQPLPNQSKKLADPDFQQLVSTEDFSRIYTQFLVELPEYSTEGLQEMRGTWIKYAQGSDPKPLVDSLEGYPLEWCTAGYDTAKTQLKGGDFYTYYSRNQDGEDKIPRVAIRMEGSRIAEVRGIAPNQNLDPYIAPVVEDKMKEFGVEGEEYKEKSENMKMLTLIEQKVAKKEPLTGDDLIFLYEINAPIRGFGYEADPRAKELRLTRDPKVDAPIIFRCSSDKIAWDPAGIHEMTEVYTGPIFKDVFKKTTHLVHVHPGFPETNMRYDKKLDVGGSEGKRLVARLKDKGFLIEDRAANLIVSARFPIARKNETVRLIRLTVADLGFSADADIANVYKKAKELGLELCPSEVPPRYRTAYTNQPRNERMYFAMKEIDDFDSQSSYIFSLDHFTSGSALNCLSVQRQNHRGMVNHYFRPKDTFIFRLPGNSKKKNDQLANSDQR